MAIYDLGTASLAANGEVTGVGTTWKAPLTLIRVGATIVFKTEPVQIYTISEIISDTQINVYNPNSETVPAGTGYAILAHDGITVQGLAQDVAETLRYYQSRETEVADAVDAFNNFDSADFESKVTQVNTQHGDVVSIGAQVANDAAQVSSDKDSAAASASSASYDKDAAAASAQEAADYAASLDPANLLRKDLNLSDVANKEMARQNLGLGALSTLNIAPLANGGTGASNAAQARQNLGLGALSTLNIAPLANGGTGASNAAQARQNLGLLNGATYEFRTGTFSGRGTVYFATPFPNNCFAVVCCAESTSNDTILSTSVMKYRDSFLAAPVYAINGGYTGVPTETFRYIAIGN